MKLYKNCQSYSILYYLKVILVIHVGGQATKILQIFFISSIKWMHLLAIHHHHHLLHHINRTEQINHRMKSLQIRRRMRSDFRAHFVHTKQSENIQLKTTKNSTAAEMITKQQRTKFAAFARNGLRRTACVRICGAISNRNRCNVKYKECTVYFLRTYMNRIWTK